jgi:hypothetical protein
VITTQVPDLLRAASAQSRWVIHQYRAAYELAGTPYSDFAHTPPTTSRCASRIVRLDTQMSASASACSPNSGNTAARLARYNGLTATPLYTRRGWPIGFARPSRRYVLSVGGSRSVKRVDLAIRALAHAPDDCRS